VLNDAVNAAGVTNIGQWIRVQQHQIRHLAYFYRSQLRAAPGHHGGISRTGLQSLHRRQARFNQQSKLIMKAEPGETEWVRRVGARRYRYAGAVHRADDLQFLAVNPLPAFHRRRRSGLPRIVAQNPSGHDRLRHVLQTRVVRSCQLGQEGPRVADGECRNLPRSVPRKTAKKSLRARRVEGIHKFVVELVDIRPRQQTVFQVVAARRSG
jgi:hypothetical protein